MSSFSSIVPQIDPNVLRTLHTEFKFTSPTQIQSSALPALLSGRSCSVQAETGGGKTLCFLIPIVSRLQQHKRSADPCPYAIVLSPTRELSLQTEKVLEKLLTGFDGRIKWVTVIGGTKKSQDHARLLKANIVIGCPGRVLDHMQSFTAWKFPSLKVFCLDEADRILDSGFEEHVTQILSKLPKTDLQLMLFSATQDHTARDAMQRVIQQFGTLEHISTHKNASDVCHRLAHGFVAVPPEHKFLLLYTLLKKYHRSGQKVLVFVATCNQVRYFADLLNYLDIPCTPLHGQMRQSTRTSTFHQFCAASHGVTLLTTDVAARGLDFPAVDWVVQLDAPESVTKYVHRVGRTARGEQGCGNALLMLSPQETPFLDFLTAKLTNPLQQYAMDTKKLNVALQMELQSLVGKNYYLRRSAHEAYKSFLQSYATHSLKVVFDVYALDLSKVATGFGMETAPIVDLGLSESSLRKKRAKRVRHDE